MGRRGPQWRPGARAVPALPRRGEVERIAESAFDEAAQMVGRGVDLKPYVDAAVAAHGEEASAILAMQPNVLRFLGPDGVEFPPSFQFGEGMVERLLSYVLAKLEDADEVLDTGKRIPIQATRLTTYPPHGQFLLVDILAPTQSGKTMSFGLPIIIVDDTLLRSFVVAGPTGPLS